MSTKTVLVLAMALGGAIALEGCVDAPDTTASGTLEEDLQLPPPTNLAVTVNSTTEMTLTWDASAGATKYIVLRGPSTGTETTFTSVPVSPTTFVYNHLSPNTQYCWEVENVSSTNTASGPSNEVCASTGSAPAIPVPQNVTATAISSSRITVSWQAVTGATSYQIYQAVSPNTPTYLTSVSGSTLSYTSTGLTASTTYGYQVAAVTSAGTSALSTPVATATTFALGLELYYKFDQNSGTTTPDLSGFNRTGTLAGGAVFGKDKPNVLNDISVIDLPAGGTVTTPNQSAFGFGSPFSLAAWVKIPTAGSNFYIAGLRSAGCGTVGWELGQDATSLYFAGSAGRANFNTLIPVGTWTHVAVTHDATTFRMYVNGVQVASQVFTVSNHLTVPLAIGSDGGCTGGEVMEDEFQIYSRALSAQEVATMGTLPPPPTNLVATVNSSTQETLTWSSTVSNPVKYIIYKGTAPGNETFFTSSPPTSTTFSYGHLTPNTQYSWEVAVAAGNLFSNPSNEAIATTSSGPPAPTGVTATALSSTRVQVSWMAVTGAVAYRVYMSTSGGPYNFIGSTTTTTSFVASNLTTMTMYSFEVADVDSGMTQSPMSAPASVTTP